MAAGKLFTEADVQKLLEYNSAPPFGRRNSGLILSGAYWGLTPLETSLVSTEDLMSPDGEFKSKWTLPANASFNGVPRNIHTEASVIEFFQKYVELRIERHWYLSGLTDYQGLDPKSRFFLNDKGEPYKVTERKNKPGSFQPRSMDEQLNRMIARANLTGATPASFRDSYIKAMHENGCTWPDLMAVTGIKQKRTLELKVMPKKQELEKVLKGLLSNLKLPDSL